MWPSPRMAPYTPAKMIRPTALATCGRLPLGYMKLHFNYSIDCELPPDGRFGGPATWSRLRPRPAALIDRMDKAGVLAGASLFVYPDVARKQASLFRQIASIGVEIGLHLNGWRYSRLAKPAWLGSMVYEDQKAAIQLAKADLEDSLGQECLGYRACYASANDDTYPILEELGFEWSSTSASGSHKPLVFACWSGGWPFPHHPSAKNKLVVGNLKIYEIPNTRGLRTAFMGDPDRPLDMRVETPLEAIGPEGEQWRKLIEENLVEMERRNQPVRAVIGASHNTNPYADLSSLQGQNLGRVIGFARQLAAVHGYEFTPAHFGEIKAEAERVDAF